MKPVIIIAIAFGLSIIGFNSMNFASAYQSSEPIPEIILQLIPEPTPELIPEPTPKLIPELPEPESPQESEKSSNGEPIIIPDEDKSANNQIIWVFVIISFIIMGFVILKKKSSSN